VTIHHTIITPLLHPPAGELFSPPLGGDIHNNMTDLNRQASNCTLIHWHRPLKEGESSGYSAGKIRRQATIMHHLKGNNHFNNILVLMLLIQCAGDIFFIPQRIIVTMRSDGA
jgi:hypothetical protein